VLTRRGVLCISTRRSKLDRKPSFSLLALFSLSRLGSACKLFLAILRDPEPSRVPRAEPEREREPEER
jgi:hypothetical protein